MPTHSVARSACSIDLAGDALSRRGYRLAGGEAPLRENLAAGILVRAGWPRIAAAGGEFLDPMCGSGTFVIEAAWIATDTAPGLLRDYWGFVGWRGHDAALWEQLVAAREGAHAAAAAGDPRCRPQSRRHRHGAGQCATRGRRARPCFRALRHLALSPRTWRPMLRLACCASIHPMACASRARLMPPPRIAPSARRCADPLPHGMASSSRVNRRWGS